MPKNDLEGSLVLEQLNEAGKLEDFLDAVDSDDLVKVKLILTRAQIDSDTIEKILDLIENGEIDF